MDKQQYHDKALSLLNDKSTYAVLNSDPTSKTQRKLNNRYVDDVISAVSGNKAERLLSHLNSVEPSIQFTLEREKDRHLPFLDLNVSRGVQGNLETSVYRKPTHADKYLAFDSHHPATGLPVIPYIQGVTEPIKRILNSHKVKVSQKPFQTSVRMHWRYACFELKT